MPKRWWPGQRAQYDEAERAESASYLEQYMRENRLTVHHMARLMRCGPQSISAMLAGEVRSGSLIKRLLARAEYDPVAPAAPGIDPDLRRPERYNAFRRWYTEHPALRLSDLEQLLSREPHTLIGLWDGYTIPKYIPPQLDELHIALQIAANEPETYATIRAWRIKRGKTIELAAAVIGTTVPNLKWIENGPAQPRWRAAMARHDLRRTLDAST